MKILRGRGDSINNLIRLFFSKLRIKLDPRNFRAFKYFILDFLRIYVRLKSVEENKKSERDVKGDR